MLLQTKIFNDPEFKKAFSGVNIYGVTGSNGSGKDTVMDIIARNGYLVFNTGDSLRQIGLAVLGTTRRGGNDAPMGRIANFERTVYPGGMVSLGLLNYWLSVLHLPQEYQPKGLLIGSIRSVSEAETLQNFGGKLIAVDASSDIRYKRVSLRKRDYEANISFKEFISQDEAEMGRNETDKTKFGIAQVIDMADIKIENNFDNFDDLEKAVEKLLNI